MVILITFLVAQNSFTSPFPDHKFINGKGEREMILEKISYARTGGVRGLSQKHTRAYREDGLIENAVILSVSTFWLLPLAINSLGLFIISKLIVWLLLFETLERQFTDYLSCSISSPVNLFQGF